MGSRIQEFSLWLYNWKQVQLPAATKASIREASADVKERGLFSGASYLEDGDSCLKAHVQGRSPSPHLSEGRGFYKKGEENRAKRLREGVAKFSTCRWVQSIPIRQVMVWYASPCFRHLPARCPGFMSSRLHGWRSADLLELGRLKVRVWIFWS